MMSAAVTDLRFQLEMLADGELSPAQRDALLARLPLEPEGWRLCAEAFLQAQIIGTALRTRHATPAPRFWPSAVAVAAGLAIAFGLGLGWPRPLPENPRQPSEVRFALQPAEERVPEFSPPNWNEVLIEARVDRGMVTYATPHQLPEFMLESLVESGHRVELVPRTVTVDLQDGGVFELPFVETLITPRENFHL